MTMEEIELIVLIHRRVFFIFIFIFICLIDH